MRSDLEKLLKKSSAALYLKLLKKQSDRSSVSRVQKRFCEDDTFRAKVSDFILSFFRQKRLNHKRYKANKDSTDADFLLVFLKKETKIATLGWSPGSDKVSQKSLNLTLI